MGGEPWLSADVPFVVNEWFVAVLGLGQSRAADLRADLMLAGIVSNLMQIGFLFLPEKLMPDITRLDPLKGFGRIFSLANFVHLLFGIFKIDAHRHGRVPVSVEAEGGDSRPDGPFRAGNRRVLCPRRCFGSSIKIAFALLILALLDYGFQWWKHEKDLRMTSQEIREEMKNLEGNPQVISRRKQVQRQLAMSRMSSAVPKADVVITNPTELAVAIQYDPEEMAAPIVVAKGAGEVAKRIRKLALENDVPIVEKKPLAQALYRDVDIGKPIPSEKYAAVAEVLAYVYQLKGKKIPTPDKH